MSRWPGNLDEEDFERMLRKVTAREKPAPRATAAPVKPYHPRGPNRSRTRPIITDGAVRRLLDRLHAGLRP